MGFLQYRLLVNVDLDCLGIEKYKFFTTDRSKIKDSELTNGFVDKVIKNLAESETLKALNKIIAEKSMKSSVDQEFVSQITEEIKEEYLELLTNGEGQKHFTPGKTNKDVDVEKTGVLRLYRNYFVKEIRLYDDKMIIEYNTPKTINLDESQGFSFYDGNIKMPYVIQNKKYCGLKDFRLIMRI